MAEDMSVTTEIAATPEAVYALVADLPRMHEWSPENDSVTWRKGATRAEPGAAFSGANRLGKKTWSTRGTVVEAVPGRALSFRVTAAGMKVALWSYRFEPTDSGCAVTESWVDERGGFVTFAGRLMTGVSDRPSHNRAGMEQTLANLKAAAEA